MGDHREVLVSASATASGPTGVEMEALMAATFAALNLLLTPHSSPPSLAGSRSRSGPSPPVEAPVISGRVLEVYLRSKTGGKSGDYTHDR